jgi:hypothetical protein
MREMLPRPPRPVWVFCGGDGDLGLIEDEEVGSAVGGATLGVVLLLMVEERIMLPAPPRPIRVVVLEVDIAGSVRRYGGG